mmetsp:Transcript_10371/g.23460  ORF Transcript_10371/g.23460 Transcript_10371/m.23460 type:complete len:201 (-) Transcript_10371:863-1465(-)
MQSCAGKLTSLCCFSNVLDSSLRVLPRLVWHANSPTRRSSLQSKDPGATTGIRYSIAHLKPRGDQSTNCTLRMVFTRTIAAITSFGRTSPRKDMLQLMYFPSHDFPDRSDSTAAVVMPVISGVDEASNRTGDTAVVKKCKPGIGTWLRMIDCKSSFTPAPPKRTFPVNDDRACAMISQPPRFQPSMPSGMLTSRHKSQSF